MSSQPTSSDNITRDVPNNIAGDNHDASTQTKNEEQQNTNPQHPKEKNAVSETTVDGQHSENHNAITDDATHPNSPKPNMTRANSDETIQPTSPDPDPTLPEEIENGINAARLTMAQFDQRLTKLEAGVEHLQQQLQDQAARTQQLEAEVFRLIRTADSQNVSILQIFQRIEEWYWFR
ncbi:hypothetical protein BO86DRAFT_376590 [Aspergillus japonicus CBS 114.51]|uniref:Uncharacterized protein n=2 Tax=Aspergillus TaxID=5052 RepID=A0A2V5HGP6_ASPV1|nr:hypothetical protein BO86DRAFT_376590 [Aspergillus japonicus CBS 114.51]PYI23588.1 hypothetical protein BO99DRAFT_428871 [Aspergillus violaceofuscus CBS 115571]RAH84980.1 hypothetical protein BO86DRAFT_376590 [Aspergillus japonicus CBS 114.51]